tara:strand:+ start:130 stop:906 length:777 start_codon:yes stop_codon:yes gene_type:complete
MNNVVTMRCNHQMCNICYYNWTDKSGKNTCPCCRDDINKTNRYKTLLEVRTILNEEIDELHNDREYYKDELTRVKREYNIVNERLTRVKREYNIVNERLISVEEEQHELFDFIKENKELIPDKNASLSSMICHFKKLYQQNIKKAAKSTIQHLNSIFKQLPQHFKPFDVFKVMFKIRNEWDDGDYNNIDEDVFGNLFETEEVEYENDSNDNATNDDSDIYKLDEPWHRIYRRMFSSRSPNFPVIVMGNGFQEILGTEV